MPLEKSLGGSIKPNPDSPIARRLKVGEAMDHRPPPPRRHGALLGTIPAATTPVASRHAGPAAGPHVPDAALQNPVAVAHIRLRRGGRRFGADVAGSATDGNVAAVGSDPFRGALVPYRHFPLGAGSHLWDLFGRLAPFAPVPVLAPDDRLVGAGAGFGSHGCPGAGDDPAVGAGVLCLFLGRGAAVSPWDHALHLRKDVVLRVFLVAKVRAIDGNGGEDL